MKIKEKKTNMILNRLAEAPASIDDISKLINVSHKTARDKYLSPLTKVHKVWVVEGDPNLYELAGEIVLVGHRTWSYCPCCRQKVERYVDARLVDYETWAES